jgi:hypothetical protein
VLAELRLTRWAVSLDDRRATRACSAPSFPDARIVDRGREALRERLVCEQKMHMIRADVPCKISMSSVLQISRIRSRRRVPTLPRRTGLRYFGMNTKWHWQA